MADLNAQLNELIGKVKTSLMNIGAKIGLIKKSPGAASKTSTPVAKKTAVKTPKPKFNFEMFIQATRQFWTKFMEEKVPAFFKNPGPYFKKYPSWFGALGNDEKVSHVGVYLGAVCLVLGIVFIFV